MMETRPDMGLDDYPAAHSMDTNWYAVDGEGRVGLFHAGSDGPHPNEPSGPEPGVILPRLLALRLDQADRPASDPDEEDEDLDEGHARAGVYVFEASDGEDASPPIEIHENSLAFPYRLVLRPDQPLHVDQLPPDLRSLFQAVCLPASRFAAGEHLQPAGQVPGAIWYSYSAVLVAYLDVDGVTIRPIPGQEEEFAVHCRDLLQDLRRFPETQARLRFDPPI